MKFQLIVTPTREDRISMYSRMNIPNTFDVETFEQAQQMAHMLFDLYNFREIPVFQEEWEGFYLMEGEGLKIEIKEI